VQIKANAARNRGHERETQHLSAGLADCHRVGVPEDDAAVATRLARAGTPQIIVDRLNAEIVKVLALPDIKERIAGQGAEVVGDTPMHFDAFLKADIARWAPLIKASGARVE
jgi:tripartite-type tricarboxylate transporter receptor subunit TctC